MKEPILVSIAHGGWKVPEEIKDIWALTKKDAFHDGDPFTPQIYDFSDKVNAQITMEYYRAAIDLNREPDNIAPENPDGLIKSLTCYNVEVYKNGILPNEKLKKLLINKYYYPYHRFLEDAARRDDIRLGVDCHSMAAVTPPIGGETAGKPRALICLGNLGDINGEPCPPHNRLSCDTELINFVKEEFIRVFQHEDVEIDIPAVCTTNVPYEGGYFEGGYITRKMGYEEIPFFQIEMSRALYLTPKYFDEDTLIVDERRIKDLNRKVWKVLKKTVRLV
ncbi:MAG: N-formylglutamate amidohydrolase [Bacteroidetes bacterium]|nr:N-formylglutamate amidohydrolase [Bacteroidota bacterium]MBL7105598.1 N-formylglutamate amidohydrolase [Bacteroidales bacterium]